MTRAPRTIGVALLLCGLAANEARGATPREMYAAAQARHRTLSAAAAPGSSRVPPVEQYRAVVSAYEAVVLRYPISGYVDDALWYAADVATQAHSRYADERDRATAIRLLRFLVDQYPASPFVAKARDQAALLDRARPTTPPAAATPGPPVSHAPLPPPAPAVPPATITDVRRAADPDAVRVSIALDADATVRSERLDNPPRLVVDLPGTRLGPSVAEGTLTFTDEAVRHVRIGRRPDQTTRVVMDLNGIERCAIQSQSGPVRVVVECERERPLLPSVPGRELPRLPPASLAPLVQAWRPPQASLVSPPTPKGAPALARRAPHPAVSPGTNASAPIVIEPRRRTAIVVGLAPLVPDTPGLTVPVIDTTARMVLGYLPPLLLPAMPRPTRGGSDPAAAEPPAAARPSMGAGQADARSASQSPARDAAPPPSGSRTSTPLATPVAAAPIGSGFTIARQLGLAASRVVVDPGHGGRDPGALGRGMNESAVVLDVSLRLERLLVDAGVDVVMTRRADEYVSLEERTAIANRAGGDLFLSVHANASRNRAARGIESYVLNFATEAGAEEVAARENASSDRTMSSLPDLLRAITLNNKLNESKWFAGLIQQALATALRPLNKALVNHGVKQAPFVVLIGASMPSVLVEISFITHPQEGRLLESAAYRQKVAEALFKAVRAYQASLKRTQAGTRQ